MGALLLLTLPLPWLAGAAAAACVHELGHLLAIWLLDAGHPEFRMGCTGAKLHTAFSEPWREFVCAAAGPAAGLLLLTAVRWFPRTAVCGLVQSAYNLLPIYPLDGGRMIRCVLLARLPITQAEHISEIVSFAACAVLLLIGVFLTFFRKSGLWPLGTAAYLTVRLLMLARRTDAVQ